MESEIYLNPQIEEELRISDLLKRLTLEEKFKLMSGATNFTTYPIPRLKIPEFGMTDGPHGAGTHSANNTINTYFPASIGLAATWNELLTKQFGIALGQEVRACGRHAVMAPGMNICRTPLNGRTFEYFSEDPYLNGQLVIPLVEGIQSQRIAACLKHFACNNTEIWRKFSDSIVDERTLEEVYFKGFKRVIQAANPWMIMGSYNKINGKYVFENPELLADKVCSDWGFENLIVSDWGATFYLRDPSVCIKSRLSLEMPKSIVYTIPKLQSAYTEGLFTDEELNECLRRLLKVMFKVGLFDPKDIIPPGSRNTSEHQDLARQIAEESCVLLKNSSDLLPLDKAKIKTVCLVGDMADYNFAPKLYGGSSAVAPPYYISVKKGLMSKLDPDIKFVKDPKSADVAIVVTGWNHSWFNDNEGTDRHSLALSRKKAQLIQRIAKQNSKTIVVLFGGGPCLIDEWIQNIASLLVVWQPHQEGGNAIANILLGVNTPSGKLPITYPKQLEDLPVHSKQFPLGRTYPNLKINVINMGFYELFWTLHPPKKSRKTLEIHYDEGINIGYRYFDKMNIEPLFPFGFGLSYTTFEWSQFNIDRTEVNRDETIEISIRLKNIGKFSGAEVIQVYYQDLNATVERPPRELCGFKKLFLNPTESELITIPIHCNDFSYYNIDSHEWKIESGEFELFVGNSSHDIKFEEKIILN
jgi:beta-glucosidase